MQSLLEAIPGLRDLRAPLIAGYTWLLFAWLASKPDLDHVPTSPILASAYDLGQRLGHIGLAVAVSVVAYLVGSVSREIMELLRFTRFGLEVGEVSVSVAAWEPFMSPAGKARMLVDDAEDNSNSPGERLAISDLQDVISHEEGIARLRLSRELDLPSSIILAEHPQLANEVDRCRSEAELRVAVAPAFIAISVLFAVEQSGWCWLALPVAFAMVAQGLRRDADARLMIAQAISTRRVESDALQGFEQWSEAIPEKIDERRRVGREADRINQMPNPPSGIPRRDQRWWKGRFSEHSAMREMTVRALVEAELARREEK